MIEITGPGWLAIVVDGGRHGFADIGVPPSPALDMFAYRAVNALLGNEPHGPALEVMGSEFGVSFAEEMVCAITGAHVVATLNGEHIEGWRTFTAPKGSELRVRETSEGLRYYIGFGGVLGCDEVMGSCTTNIECRFGGFLGRPLLKGDVLIVKEKHREDPLCRIPVDCIPSMASPHRIRVIEGPEWNSFDHASREALAGEGKTRGFLVSTKVNRTGIRLEGGPLVFKENAEKSIISEGVLPGTIQVPGDGVPIIVLHERTIGGYARIGVVVKSDLDRLAHLKPRDQVIFEFIGIDASHRLWQDTCQRYERLP